jgi:hypothetical protein
MNKLCRSGRTAGEDEVLPSRHDLVSHWGRYQPDRHRFGQLPAEGETLEPRRSPVPATKIVVGDSRHFEASGLDRKHWTSGGPIRKISWMPSPLLGCPISIRTAYDSVGRQIDGA